MPLIPFSEWKNPTDHAYAFRLRAGLQPRVDPVGLRREISEIATEALADGEAQRFEEKIDRWTGPEDAAADATTPYAAPQRTFEERAWTTDFTPADLETVLRGTVLAFRRRGRCDYVMRDHHTLDVVLAHYRATGELPTAMFHADRHSDWCADNYLEARRPQQAATWWRLVEGLKRPDTQAPVLRERDLLFTTAQPERTLDLEGRDIGASTRVPGCVDSTALDWRQVLEREAELAKVDWVSIDLDYLQPAQQLRLTGGLLRDPRFHALMARAKVRLFVLSPQFARGGDRLRRWVVAGSRPTAIRLLRVLRSV